MLLSLFFTTALNWAFFAKVYGYLATLSHVDTLFWLAIPVVVMAAFYFLLSLLVIPKIDRYLLPALVIGSAVVSLVGVQYGIIFDHTMIENFVETDIAEAKTYFSVFSVAYVGLLGVVPALVIANTKIEYHPVKRELLQRGIGIVVSLVVFGGVAGAFYKDFASTGRNNRAVHQYLVPNQLIYSVAKYGVHAFKGQGEPFKDLTAGAHHQSHEANPELMILVLGETARASNFAWDGYTRDTNPYTKEAGFLSLGAVSSCGTATAFSVPCMFSFLNRDQYTSGAAGNQSNLLDVVAAADFSVRWIDNNSGCKGVCKRVVSERIDVAATDPLCDGEFCFDEVLTRRVNELLAQPLERDTLLVLHMIGSHGPTYYRRYPKNFRQFLPDCQQSDIQNCSNDEIVNTYDNTILYTDYVLATIADTLESRLPDAPTSVLYISDHGESLGEHGLYLHGMPYAISPEEQRSVPELLWLSDGFRSEHNLTDTCIQHNLESQNPSHDNLSHTVLGMLGIHSTVYKKELDLLAPCLDVHNIVDDHTGHENQAPPLG